MLGARRVGYVVTVGHRPAAGRTDLPGHILGRAGLGAGAVLRSAEVVDHHGCTLGRQEQRVLPADAASGPGHHGYLLVQGSHATPCHILRSSVLALLVGAGSPDGPPDVLLAS